MLDSKRQWVIVRDACAHGSHPLHQFQPQGQTLLRRIGAGAGSGGHPPNRVWFDQKFVDIGDRFHPAIQQALAARFGIRSIPTLILFREGREVTRQAGALGAVDIMRWMRAHG